MGKDPKNVIKSTKRTTTPLRAVFPYVHEVAKYGDYEINADLFEETDLHEEIKAVAREVWKQGAKEHGFDPDERRPDNELFKEGKTKPKDGSEGEDFFRVCFKMKPVRKVKGKEIQQKPQVVDSQLSPMTDPMFSGSTVQIRWFLQFTHVNGKFYLSPKFSAVKVIQLIGPNGEESIDDAFDADEDGFVTKGEVEQDTDDEAEVEAPQHKAKAGSGF